MLYFCLCRIGKEFLLLFNYYTEMKCSSVYFFERTVLISKVQKSLNKYNKTKLSCQDSTNVNAYFVAFFCLTMSFYVRILYSLNYVAINACNVYLQPLVALILQTTANTKWKGRKSFKAHLIHLHDGMSIIVGKSRPADYLLFI